MITTFLTENPPYGQPVQGPDRSALAPFTGSPYEGAMPYMIKLISVIWEAVDRDIREWTKPETEDPTHLLNWLQDRVGISTDEDAPRPELHDYRLWARGVACNLMWKRFGDLPASMVDSSDAWNTRYDADTYWRCISICSAAWIKPTPRTYGGT